MDKVEDIVGRLKWDSTHCRDCIGDTIRRIGRDCSEAADLIQSQQALIEEMREALKPFADRCDEAVRPDDSDRDGVTVRTGALRRAKALSQKE